VLGRDHETGLVIAASLAQIGEFSFVLIVMAVKLDIVPEQARDLVVAGAMLSILVNPLLFHLIEKQRAPETSATPEAPSTAAAE
jgi:CPA2 family monovalent cation:H+ antiporter-2